MKTVTTIAFAFALGISGAAAAQDQSADSTEAQNAQESTLDPLDPAGVHPQPPATQTPDAPVPDYQSQEPVGPPDDSMPPLLTPMEHEGAQHEVVPPASAVPNDEADADDTKFDTWDSAAPGETQDSADDVDHSGPA